MSSNLFGTDGIRGEAGVYPLNQEGTTQVGKAIGMHFAKPGERILVGYDPRESSPALAGYIVDGLSAVGVASELIGVIPTPGLAYVTKHSSAVAGVMITASHNPYSDNGIKVFGADGGKLSDETQDALSSLIDSNIEDRGTGSTEQNGALTEDYQKFLVDSMQGTKLTGIRLVIDMANGATSGIASRVFSELGAEVIALSDQPNGTNINVACGATDTRALQQAVIDNKADGGVAFDGDGDRVIMVDGKGRELTGDHILYILALSANYSGVVATSMSNMGFEKALKQKDIDLLRTDVGDRYVLEGMEKTGYVLGGEQSGHIILGELTTTGDGILAATQLLRYVTQTDKKLEDWYDELPLLPQALVNIRVANKAHLNSPHIQQFVSAESDAMGDRGRLNIRPSGTEPKVRVMVESPDAEQDAQRIAEQLEALFKQESENDG